MAERHLYRIVNQTPLTLEFDVASPASPASQGRPNTLAPHSLGRLPGNPDHWTIPTIGRGHAMHDHPCEIVFIDAAGHRRFAFSFALDLDSASPGPRGWMHGGFTVYAGKPVTAGCPAASRILEPFPPLGAESRDIFLFITGADEDGLDLRVDLLPYTGDGHLPPLKPAN